MSFKTSLYLNVQKGLKVTSKASVRLGSEILRNLGNVCMYIPYLVVISKANEDAQDFGDQRVFYGLRKFQVCTCSPLKVMIFLRSWCISVQTRIFSSLFA